MLALLVNKVLNRYIVKSTISRCRLYNHLHYNAEVEIIELLELSKIPLFLKFKYVLTEVAYHVMQNRLGKSCMQTIVRYYYIN